MGGPGNKSRKTNLVFRVNLALGGGKKRDPGVERGCRTNTERHPPDMCSEARLKARLKASVHAYLSLEIRLFSTAWR